VCGLAGIFVTETCSRPASYLGEVLSRMTYLLRNRGPDESGELICPPVVLGHRRLSILELTDAGAQPMRLGSDGPIIAYNGEVYNFNELRRALEVR